MRLRPGFLMRTTASPVPRKTSRAGAAVSASGFGVAPLVPAEAGTSARANASSVRVIDRSP
jgi:hypothetical protein